jgi:hypothetical protein
MVEAETLLCDILITSEINSFLVSSNTKAQYYVETASASKPEWAL